YHLQNYWSLSDDVFYTKGKHALKFGFLGNRIQFIVGETVWGRGRVNFQGGLPAFLQNQPSQELAAIPGGIERRHFRYETYGFYGQDDWRATSRLALNLGLRYEFNTTVNEIPWAPWRRQKDQGAWRRPYLVLPSIWLTSWFFSTQKYSMISAFTSKGDCPYIVNGRVLV